MEQWNKITHITSATKETFTRPIISYVEHVLLESEPIADAINGRGMSQPPIWEPLEDVFVLTSVAGTEERVLREGTVRGTEGLTRFALPECRGRVFGRDTKVRAPRIPWLRLPGWANICVSRRRDFVAKSRAASSRSSETKLIFAFDEE